MIEPVLPVPDTCDCVQRMDVVVVGHVDHGKSTVIGRLMADTGSLPQGKLEQVKAMCARNARPFEYAFLLDALKNEQAQGITIDTARCFFKTANRHYVLHDAPGHVEFLKNMITGASRAQAALLVIDADEGVAENSKRHGYILGMLGIRQIAVLVNKMDLLGWERDAYQAVVDEYAAFLARLGVRPARFIPVAARDGGNIVERAAEASWYDGPTVLEQVEAFRQDTDDVDRPFRMPLQDVYKFTAEGDDRRIFAGTVETGRVAPGDEVVFLPSGKRSKVRSIETLEGPAPAEARAGQAVGLTLETQVYAKPGELLVRAHEAAASAGTRFRANVFWMGRAPLVPGRRYTLRVGAARVAAQLAEVVSVLDASELESVAGKVQVDRHDVAEVVLTTTRPVAFDTADTLEATARFVVVDGYDIAGCGNVLEALSAEPDEPTRRRRLPGTVTAKERMRRYGHAGKAVVFVGGSGSGAAEAGMRLERRLHDLGAHAYFLGLPASGARGDKEDALAHDEHLLRVGEVAWAMADAGIVLVTVLGDVDSFDLRRLRALAAPHELFVVALGEAAEFASPDVALPDATSAEAAASAVVRALNVVGVLPEYEI